eukprot:6481182-Amphidinium_carterae.1
MLQDLKQPPKIAQTMRKTSQETETYKLGQTLPPPKSEGPEVKTTSKMLDNERHKLIEHPTCCFVPLPPPPAPNLVEHGKAYPLRKRASRVSIESLPPLIGKKTARRVMDFSSKPLAGISFAFDSYGCLIRTDEQTSIQTSSKELHNNQCNPFELRAVKNDRLPRWQVVLAFIPSDPLHNGCCAPGGLIATLLHAVDHLSASLLGEEICTN